MKGVSCLHQIKTLRPSQNQRHFPDISKCIFLNENISILIKIYLKFVPMGPINNIPASVQIIAWCQSGDKPLSEQMMVILLTHIYVIRPQLIKVLRPLNDSSSIYTSCHKNVYWAVANFLVDKKTNKKTQWKSGLWISAIVIFFISS